MEAFTARDTTPPVAGPATSALALAFAVSALILFALPATAEAERGWSLRASGVHVDPRYEETIEGSTIAAESATGFALGVEYRWNKRIGASLDVLSADLDLGVEVLDDGEFLRADGGFSFQPVVLGLQFHFEPHRKVDLWVAPVVAWIDYGNPSLSIEAGGLSQTARFRADDDVSVGGEVGIDLQLGSGPWSLTANALFLDTTLEITDDEGEDTSLDIEPLMTSVGVRYRF